jgi:cobalamin biosynthesis Mg chelatase CobN
MKEGNSMKKILALVISMVMVMMLASCTSSNSSTTTSKVSSSTNSTNSTTSSKSSSTDSSSTSSKTDTKTGTQIANPFVDCETMEDAATICGFKMTVPDNIEGYSERKIQAVKDSMLQVIDYKGDDQILMRKQSGSGDISGDYNTYSNTQTVTVGSYSITMKGNNDTVSVATWENGTYAYAVDATGDGLTVETMKAIIQSIS